MSRYMTAKDAADALGITLATLYSYVSRGLIRSESTGEKQRRYYAEDVEKLLLRKEATRNPEKMAETALNWGAPVLESALTLIDEHHLYYRGRDVLHLAMESTVEDVAALMWNVEHLPEVDLDVSNYLTAQVSHLTDLQQLQMALTLAAADDFTAYDLRKEAVIHTGARILRLLTLVAVDSTNFHTNIVETLCFHWCPDNDHAAMLINAVLILCADHELNASSFTARVIASAGATPYAAVIGGLSAFQGVKHGGHVERVGAFLREIRTPAEARQVIAERLRRGEGIAGFGHRLYPEGDPRAIKLLELVAEYYPESPALEIGQAVLQEIRDYPTIDFALVIIAQILNLPASKGAVMFALGRTIGWIAHAIEQYQEDVLIRPRARYIGQQPLDG